MGYCIYVKPFFRCYGTDESLNRTRKDNITTEDAIGMATAQESSSCTNHSCRYELLYFGSTNVSIQSTTGVKGAVLPDAGILHVFLKSGRVTLGLLQDTLHNRVLEDCHDL